jgi:CPA2 family monovalent cation:H+ antiporter-2
MGIITNQFYSIILSAAIITMLLTPISIGLFSKLYPALTSKFTKKEVITKKLDTQPSLEQSETPNKIIVAGYGRVGQNIAQGLYDAGIPYLIIDTDPERVSAARTSGRPRIYGDASNLQVLSQTGLDKARALVITYPDPMAVVTTAKLALTLNPKLKILARVHRAKEADELKKLGVYELVSPEYEASYRFIKRLLNIMDLEKEDRKRILKLVRSDEEITEFNPDKY